RGRLHAGRLARADADRGVAGAAPRPRRRVPGPRPAGLQRPPVAVRPADRRAGPPAARAVGGGAAALRGRPGEVGWVESARPTTARFGTASAEVLPRPLPF